MFAHPTGEAEVLAFKGLQFVTGITLGLLFNPMTGPGTRRWVSEKIFGGGEDDYTFPQNDSVGYNDSVGSPPPAA